MEIVYGEFLAKHLKTDFLHHEAVPFQDAFKNSRVAGLAVAFEKSEASPRAFRRGDSAMPFGVWIEPGALLSLLAQDEFRAEHGEIAIAAFASDGIQLPIIENPIALGLKIAIGIFPAHRRQIALNETPNAVIQADTLIGPDQGAAIPM